MEATNKGDATDSHVEGSLVVESREQFTAYVNPLVQQPPTADTSFHSPMEGRTDSPVETEYGPNAPFWRTSMGNPFPSFGLLDLLLRTLLQVRMNIEEFNHLLIVLTIFH